MNAGKTVSVRIRGDGEKAQVKVYMSIDNIGTIDMEVEDVDLKDALVAAVNGFDVMQRALVAELRRLGLAQKPDEKEKVVS